LRQQGGLPEAPSPGALIFGFGVNRGTQRRCDRDAEGFLKEIIFQRVRIGGRVLVVSPRAHPSDLVRPCLAAPILERAGGSISRLPPSFAATRFTTVLRKEGGGKYFQGGPLPHVKECAVLGGRLLRSLEGVAPE